MSQTQIEKLKENIRKTKQYPSLVVLKKEDRYVLLDGHSRLEILKELGHREAWCEVWELDNGDANLVLATLNRLHGVDDIEKRARLLGELVKDYSGEVEMLRQLLPEDGMALEKYLKIAFSEGGEATEELKRDIIEDRLMQVVDEDDARRMAKAFTPKMDEMRLSFIFDNEEQYYKACGFFGIIPNTDKLVTLMEKN